MLVRFRAYPTSAAHSKFVADLCRTGQQSLWGICMAWVKSMKKSRRVSNGSEPESPLAGVNQELAGTKLKCELSVFCLLHQITMAYQDTSLKHGPTVYCLLSCDGSSPAQQSTAQHSIRERSAAHHTTPHTHTTPHHTTPHHTTPHHTTPHHTTPHHTTPHHTTPHHTTPHHTTPHHTTVKSSAKAAQLLHLT